MISVGTKNIKMFTLSLRSNPGALRCIWILCVLPVSAFIIFHNNQIDHASSKLTTDSYFTNPSNSSSLYVQYMAQMNVTIYNVTYNGTRKVTEPWNISNYNFTWFKEIMKDDADFRLNFSMTLQDILNNSKDSVKSKNLVQHHFSSYPNMDLSGFIDNIVEHSNVEQCPEDIYLAVFVHISFQPDTLIKVAKIR